MGLMDKIKDLAKITDEDYFDDADNAAYEDDYARDEAAESDIYDEQPVQEEAPSYRRRRVNYQPADHGANRVVDIRSGSRSQVVFKKLDKYENVREVADELNEKKIVVLNLETCPSDVSRRILDFLCGVAYANSGDITRVAVRTYIITPYNVPVTGEMLDQAEGGADK